jgi:TonB family protein
MKRNKAFTGSEQEHLPLAVLRRYQQGLLPAAGEHQVERHLLGCALCADILAGMKAQTSGQSAAAAREISRRLAASRARQDGRVIPLFSRRNLAAAASLLLLVCAGVLVFFYNLEKAKQGASKPIAATPPAARDTARQAPVPAGPSGLPPAAEQPVAVLRPASPPATVPQVRQQQQPAANQQSAAASQAPTLAMADAAGTADEDLVLIEMLPPQTAAPATMADSGFTKRGAIASAPASVLMGKAAGVNIRGRSSVLARKQEIATTAQTEAATGKAITGVVMDASGQPLPGVNVQRKGSSQGTVTDAQGGFSLPLPGHLEEATLTFNYIGFVPLEKKVSTQGQGLAAAEVRLEADSQALSEVVVVGFGAQKKEALTGAIAGATPVGGWDSFKQYLKASLKQPAEADGKKRAGRVVVGFTVNTDGRLSDVRVLKSLSPATDAEALRLVQQAPAWKPAKAGPQAGRITIRFRGQN